ncbi:unnamed protein product [Protopolystoma xenopodis]|uniref:Ferritin n=1 Tax=Protopolystoma xenopodis TaxID=117903 RepID=A0A3S5B7L9_9PLAT|nr:unnamed protein product [Protopolystoma xenopodis]
MPGSRCRQNYHEECEAGINRQINMELAASYSYLALYAYFGRDDVALTNAAKFFKKASHEETEHAEKLIDYQLLRGGRVKYQEIKAPVVRAVDSLKAALELAIVLEKEVNEVSADANHSWLEGQLHVICII